MRNSASIFTAEVTALYTCLSHLTRFFPPLKFLILSDSLSSLLVIQDFHSTNPIVQWIHILIHSLTSSLSSISILWIPGHIDLEEHDAVHRAAKQSLLSPTIHDPSPSSAHDFKSFYRSLILSFWHDFWFSSHKLQPIKKTLNSLVFF